MHFVASIRSLSVCAAPAAALLLAATANAGIFDYTLDMSTDPVAEGWILQASGGAHAVAGGVLTIDSPMFRQFRAPDALWNDQVDNAQGWMVESRLRVTTAGESPNSRVQLWLHDNLNFNRLEIFQDRVTLQAGFLTDTYLMDTVTAFHTYQVVAQGNNSTLFVDGVERISIDWVTAAGGTFAMNFGDGHGSFASTSEWDYVTLRHLPAPGAAVAIALAAVVAPRRRR